MFFGAATKFHVGHVALSIIISQVFHGYSIGVGQIFRQTDKTVMLVLSWDMCMYDIYIYMHVIHIFSFYTSTVYKYIDTTQLNELLFTPKTKQNQLTALQPWAMAAALSHQAQMA